MTTPCKYCGNSNHYHDIDASLHRFFLGWLGCWLPLALGIAWVAEIPWRYPITPTHKLLLLVPLYLLAPLTLELHRRYGGGLSWADYGMAGLGSTLKGLGVGLGVAILGILLLLALELALGWRRWRPSADPPNLTLVLALVPLTLLIGGVEELIFRGILVSGLWASALPWLGVVILSSALFAISHLVWDGPAGVPSLPGLGLMGGVLCLARWAMAGNLGLAWGLHSGWILALALSDALALTPRSPTTPRLAGQPDQPLTSLLTLGLLLLTGLGLGGYGLGG